MNDDLDTRRLVDEASRGDGDAVDALVARHLPALHAFIRLNMCGSSKRREDTVDLVQSACREVLDDLRGHEWVSESTFRRWLFTCAQTKLTDRARHWKREKRDIARDIEPTPAGDRPWEAFIAAHAPTPSREAMAHEQVERLEGAFAELSDEERRILLLARVVGLSSREIGEDVGKSEAAVRKALARATARLALRLGGTTP